MLSPDDRLKADLQLNLYDKAQGEFGNLMTKRSRMLQALAKWLEQFGHKTPELSGFAIQVLSLTCSASGCERNWSTFVDTRRGKEKHVRVVRLVDEDVEIEEHVGVIVTKFAIRSGTGTRYGNAVRVRDSLGP
ncbi:hypothetical protein OROMI_000870 [Orobanche minor]